MIEITRDDTNVVLTAEAYGPIHGTKFAMKWNAGSDWAARLLASNLNEHRSRALAAIREEAYREGWRDAKAKRAKQTWFSGMWK